MNPTTLVRTVLCVLIGLVLVGATPAAAAELPAPEGGTEVTCDVLHAEAFAAVDELDAMLPVDPIHEAEIPGRIQTITRQLDYDLLGLGC